MTTGYTSIYMVEGESVTTADIAKRTGLHQNTVYKYLRRCQLANVTPTWAGLPKPRDPVAKAAERAAAKAAALAAHQPATPSRFQQIGREALVHAAVKVRPGPTSIAAESVDAFRARGGVIHVCAPHESGNPLRFDHSNTAVPTGRRRPVVRARPAPSR